MAKNANLTAAKKAKNDEFYTQITDIEKELVHYHDQLRGKIIFCNCDDPTYSNFWRYFHLNFAKIGLKKLIATHFDPEKPTYKLEYEGGNDEDWSVGRLTVLSENGDFRSPECIELLKSCDVVVTNPPFSLFREYVAQLMQYGKKFVIIGNKNAVNYKEVFPLIRHGQMWIGYRNMNSDFWLKVPEGQVFEKRIDIEGEKDVPVKHIMACWYTNIDISKRHEHMPLFRRYADDPSKYPKYDNYDAINVDKVPDIPEDYLGVIGVPITFLDKYCPEQFEILGLSQKEGLGLHSLKTYDTYKELRQDGSATGASGHKMNGNPVMAGRPLRGNYYFDGQNYAYSLYGRIFIRRVLCDN